MKPAIFLDRDGVINKVILRQGRPFSPRKFEEFELFDGAREFLTKSKSAGFLNVVVTNQPDIARRLMKWQSLKKIHEFIKDNLAVDEIFVCPHDDTDDCLCRKPKPGLLLQASEQLNIELKSSFLIGDTWKDIQAGKAAGCTTILLDYPYNQEVQADIRISNMQAAFSVITKMVETLWNG